MAKGSGKKTLSESEETFLGEGKNLEVSTNGLSDTDASPEPFSFTCQRREYDDARDGYRYYVKPVGEYGDLDFKGHDVLINDVTRRCEDFEITEDGHIVIYVPYLTEMKSAGKD